MTHPNFRDITGERFGRLVALSHEFRHRQTYWTCRCDCGGYTEVTLGNLTTAHRVSGTSRVSRVQSCGCLRRDMMPELLAKLRASVTTHGACGTDAYLEWARYKKDGWLAPEWADSFERYRDGIGAPPFAGAVIARRDPQAVIGPQNFHWVSPEDRRERYTPGLRLLTHPQTGETKSMAAWARELGISRQAIDQRVDNGWSVERILNTKGRSHDDPNWRNPNAGRKAKRFLTIDGETKSLQEWADHYGVSYQVMHYRWKTQHAYAQAWESLAP